MATKKKSPAHAKERKYTSKQGHEQAYKGKRKSKVVTYKEKGGVVDSEKWVVYGEDANGRYKLISTHDTPRGAKAKLTRVSNKLSESEFVGVGNMKGKEWNEFYAPHSYEEGGEIVVNVWEDSYPFANSKEKNAEFTSMNKAKEWAMSQINKQRAYRSNSGKLWATFTVGGKEIFEERVKEGGSTYVGGGFIPSDLTKGEIAYINSMDLWYGNKKQIPDWERLYPYGEAHNDAVKASKKVDPNFVYSSERIGGVRPVDLLGEDQYAKGGSVHNQKEDMKYRSDEPWEKDYKRKTKAKKHPSQMAKGGSTYAGGGEIKSWLKDGTKVRWHDPEESARDLDRVWIIKDYDGQLAEILEEEDYEDFLDDLIINIESEDGMSTAEVPHWEIKPIGSTYAGGGEISLYKIREDLIENGDSIQVGSDWYDSPTDRFKGRWVDENFEIWYKGEWIDGEDIHIDLESTGKTMKDGSTYAGGGSIGSNWFTGELSFLNW
jgi:hypothetical protein